MAQSEEDRAKAAAIVAEWAWQPADGHNYRFQHAVRTLTRFYEATSMQPDELKLVIEFLKEQEIGEAGISLMNRNVDFGAGWKAKDAWYQTMPGERFANTDSTKVRVYQVLFLAANGQSGDGPYTVENGCQYRVKHTFYWDVETLPALPASSSGDEYTMQGLTRDKETGLFSCVIERKERVQQDVAEYVTARTAFETRKDEQHIGVKQQNVAATGKQASVSAGTIVKRQITKNPDCTSSIQNDTIIEEPVTSAVREFRKTLRGTVSRTLDRNQAQPLSGSGLAVGETRRSEETEGKLWNNEVQQTTGEGAGEIADGCSRSPLTHTDTTTENVAQKPTIEQAVPAANHEIRKEARRTEENTWDLTTTHVIYRPDEKTVTGGTVSQAETVTTGVNQVSVPVAAPAVNKREDVSVSLNDHGSMSTQKRTIVYQPDEKTVTGGTVSQAETVTTGVNQVSVPVAAPGVNRREDVSVSLNDHGSMSTQKRTIVYQPDEKTVTGGTVSQAETVTTGVNQTTAPTAAPGVNRREDVSVSINDHGSMSTQKRTIVYQQDIKTVTGCGTTIQNETITTGVNQTTVPMAAPAVNRREDVSVSINDHGSMSTQKRTIVYNPDSVTFRGGTSLQDEIVTSGINQTSVPTAAPAVNRREDVSVSLNDHGSMSTQKRTIVYHPEVTTKSWSDENFTYEVTTYRNLLSPMTRSVTDGSSIASFTKNDHGSYDGQLTVKVPKTISGGSALAWSISKNITANYYYFNRQGKLCHRTFTGTMKKVYGRNNHVANELYNSGVTPAYLPQLGWVTHMGDGLFTHGTLYTVTGSPGPEVVDDSSSQG